MIVQAYGKINISLNVLGKLENGFHEVDMILLPLKLHDTIEITVLKNSEESYVTSDTFDLTQAKYNIVSESIKLLKQKYNIKDGFRVTIYKRIPIAAGMGGGSSDAAAVINAIAKLYKLNLTYYDLISLAEKVGSDVPFCMFNRAARCTGRGEKIEFLENYPRYYCLIIKPEKGLTSQDVFTKSDSYKLINTNIDDVVKALNDDDDEALSQSMENALYLPATKLLPEIEDVVSSIKSDGFKLCGMTGSGSAIFVLSRNKKELFKLMKKYYDAHYAVELTKIM